MIRHPEEYFVEDRPKKLQRFFVIDNKHQEEAMEKIVVEEMEEERIPLLMVPKKERLKMELLKSVARKYLRPNTNDNFVEDLQDLETEYTWWTKFYNSMKDEEFVNKKLHQLKVSFRISRIFKIIPTPPIRSTPQNSRSRRNSNFFMIGQFQCKFFMGSGRKKLPRLGKLLGL